MRWLMVVVCAAGCCCKQPNPAQFESTVEAKYRIAPNHDKTDTIDVSVSMKYKW